MENPFAPELLIDEDGPVRIITLNRPEALNSANKALHESLIAVWKHVASDPEARAIVLTGAGKAFSAGGDMNHFLELHNDPAGRLSEIDGAAQLVREMANCPLPVVGAVNGAAVGLGCNLAVLCDVVLISDKAFISDPHVSVGLTAADGGAPTWPLFMSLSRAKEYLFTGDRIMPDVAVQLGLASRVVPHDELMAEALKLAHRFAAQPAHALRSTKQALNMHLTRAMAGILEFALAQEYIAFDNPEHQAIVHKFTGK
jgi:enoyl-CoA hydratase